MNVYRAGPETERLYHRAFVEDDAEAFYALNSNPDVMRYTCEPMPGSVEEVREAIKNHRDFDLYGYGRWGCFLKETGVLIGFCGLKFLTDLNAVDVGYRFLPQHWGKGFATEACRSSLQFGFAELGLDRIIGLVKPENLASRRVLEKVGMRDTGEMEYDDIRVVCYEACGELTLGSSDSSG